MITVVAAVIERAIPATPDRPAPEGRYSPLKWDFPAERFEKAIAEGGRTRTGIAGGIGQRC